MSRLLATTAILGALIAAPAFAQTMNDTAPPDQSQSQAQAAAQLSAQDQRFAHDAAAGGKAEIDMGQMAQQKGPTQAIKDFGQQMVQDHSKAADQLAGIAKKDGITLPTELDAKDEATRKRLDGEQGAAFARDYVRAAVATHKDAVQVFAKEAKSGQNPDLKSFASDTLPIIRHHLEMAQALRTDMNRGTQTSERNGTAGSGSSTRSDGGRSSDHTADQLNQQELQQLQK